MRKRPSPRYPIESVDNALTLLRMLAGRESIGVTEASEHLGVARSTAHRLLAMLQHHGFVRQDPVQKRYAAGPALVELGLAALRDVDIRAQARPVLERLVAETGETAHLVVLSEANILFLDCVEGQMALRAGSRTGQTLPAHCTAAGKALLAELPEERLRELYPRERLAAVTSRSIRSRAALLHELEEVRGRGYATNDGESEENLYAVAAAIRDASGRARAAITVAAPDYRMDAERVEAIAAAIQRAAAEIGAGLV